MLCVATWYVSIRPVVMNKINHQILCILLDYGYILFISLSSPIPEKVLT